MSDEKTFSMEELMQMPVSQVRKMLESKQAKFHGTAVVRTAEGKIKYDDPATRGTFMEAEEDLNDN